MRIPARPTVLFYSDIDQTLIGWERFNQGPDLEGLEQTREVLLDHQDEVVSCLSTFRGPESTARLADFIGPAPLDVLVVNSGQRRYLNDQRQPADQFLKSLPQADPSWENQIGWKVTEAIGALEEAFHNTGYEFQREAPAPMTGMRIYQKPGQDLELHWFPDYPCFFATSQAQDDVCEASQVLSGAAKQVPSALAEVGPFSGGRTILSLVPPGVDKTTPLSELLTRYPSVTTIIVAGDDPDSDTMLFETEGRPVIPIVTSEDPIFRDRMAARPEARFCEPGRLGPVLHDLLETLTTL